MRVYGVGLFGRPPRAWECAAPPTPAIALGLAPWRRAVRPRPAPLLSADAEPEDKSPLSSLSGISAKAGRVPPLPLGPTSPAGQVELLREGSADTSTLRGTSDDASSLGGSCPESPSHPPVNAAPSFSHGLRITARSHPEGELLEDQFAARVPSAVISAVAAVEGSGQTPVALRTEPTFTLWTADGAQPAREPTLSRWGGMRSRKQASVSVDWEAAQGRDGPADLALERAESGLQATDDDVLLFGSGGVVDHEPAPLGGAWRSLSDVVLKNDTQ